MAETETKRPLTEQQLAINASLQALNAAREYLKDSLKLSTPLAQLVVKNIEEARETLLMVGAPYFV
jgi:hypothetical protein